MLIIDDDMPNFDDFQGLRSALELKHALVETNQRVRYQQPISKVKNLPILTIDGNNIAAISKNTRTTSNRIKNNQRDQSVLIDKILWFYLGLVTIALVMLIIIYWHGSP